MNWATLDEVKFHLRYDDDSDDAALTNFLLAAESAVRQYITEDLPEDANGDIKVAVLMLVGYYDDNREVSKDTPSFGNYLPDPVRALLWPYRKPTAV